MKRPRPTSLKASSGNRRSTSGNGVPARSAEFEDPYSIAVDSSSNIYICDTYNRQMRVVNTGTSTITIYLVSGVKLTGTNRTPGR